ncbi:MAG: hypothetical protein EBU90_17970 [Proteobacteria bacterium]|jgi:hypothetical protein|nr:hypothetical protein [Pseudomonadota bacterium]NBP15417.1 hypothetical protein [bacterium]
MIVRKSFDKVEKESLAAHVELCTERYEAIERRLEDFDKGLYCLNKSFSAFKSTLLKAISVGTVVLTSSISILIIVLDRIH